MKIVATVSNVGAAVHAGGGVEKESAIIEIQDSQLPPLVRRYFENLERARKSNQCSYEQIEFSLLKEEVS